MRYQRAVVSLPLPVNRPDHWTESAACAGPDVEAVWFDAPHAGETEKARAARIARAKAVCARCPVVAACRADVVPGDSGVRGGELVGQPEPIHRRAPRNPRPITHGTANGAHAHRLRGERPCPSCLDAERIYRAELRAKKEAS